MKIVIIGNGAAGNAAAETIRKGDKTAKVLMISDEIYPQYSACALPDCISGWVPREKLFLKTREDYKDLNIIAKLGQTVTRIDNKKKQVILEKTSIDYDKLIIATGSRPFIPPLKGTEIPGNFVVKSVSDIDLIERHRPLRAVVVGSGNIGVETAEALEMRGCEVFLVELLDRVMPRAFDEKPSLLIRRLLEHHGIKVCTNEKVLEVEGTDRVIGVVTDKQKIPCDTVIWAVGVKQNIELASKAGINIGKLGGIKVNPKMETNQDDIYACGDCIQTFDLITGQPALNLLWPSAKKQAMIAALNCIGGNIKYEGAFNVVVEEIYGVFCVSIGLTSDAFDPSLGIIEKNSNGNYSRLLISNDHLIGLQTIGISGGIGAIMTLIKNQTPITDIKRIIKDPDLIAKIPWYWQAGDYLVQGDSPPGLA